jgi:hypothetical protein
VFAVAVRVIVAPALYHPLASATEPGPFAFMARRYCLWKTNTMVVAVAVPVNGWVENQR